MRGFEPYGDIANITGPGTTVYGFTSEQRDALGLEYLRARYYMPAQGRFFTKDPLEGKPITPIPSTSINMHMLMH